MQLVYWEHYAQSLHHAMHDEFWNTKRVLVTGANGFIGSHVIDVLVQRGSVITASIYGEHADEDTFQALQQHKNITVLHANLLNGKDCKKICEKQDIVLHCAGLDGGVTYKAKHAQEIYEKNSTITTNILRASEQAGVARFLLISSIGIYHGVSTSPMHESDALLESSNTLPHGYTRSKQESEIIAKDYATKNTIGIAIARLGNVYGPRDNIKNGRVIPTFISRALKGQHITFIGNGLEKRSFLHISDAVPALLELPKHITNGDAINIASSQYVTVREIADIIHKILGQDIPMNTSHSDDQAPPWNIISTQKAQQLFGFHEKINLYDGLTNMLKNKEKLH